jgi:tetratricopeptide (TPR) repeat protein/TolB-like protein
MSPEQAQGKDVDRRSDIWSAGAVLYEMTTGRLPFAGDYEQAVLYSILNDEPDPPTSIRTGVPMELERIALKALSKDPEERYQHADGMISDLRALRRKILEGEKQDSSDSAVESVKGHVGTQSTAEKQPHRLRGLGIAAGVVAAVLILVFVIRPLFFGSRLVAGQRPIAVISFENRTGDASYDYLSAAIPNLLITSLEQSHRLQVMTWERMHDLLEQLGRPKVETIDKALGFELCELDGIDVVVVGSYIKAGNSFAIEAKVMDVRTKKLLRTASANGEGVESILKSQIDELSRDITKNVSAFRIPERTEPVIEITTHSMEAYNYFLKGREYWIRYYHRDAELNLTRALEIDSTFASAYLYLAFVKSSNLESTAADSLMMKAMHYADRTTEKHRLFIEANYANRAENDKKKAISILEELTRKYPKEKGAYLVMSIWLSNQRRFEEAIKVLNRALILDPDFPYAVNYMGYLHMDILDYPKALEYFEHYASLTPGDPNPYDSMGDCLYRMGSIDEAMTSLRRAIEISPDFYGSRMGLSYLYGMTGDYDSSLYWMNSAVESSWVPTMKSIGTIWNTILLRLQGRYKEAKKQKEKAHDLMMKTNHPRKDIFIMAFDVWFLYEEGKYDESREAMTFFMDRAEELNIELPAPSKISMTLFRGLNAAAMGKLAEARAAIDNMDTLFSGTYFENNRSGAMQCRRMPVLLEAEVLLADGKPAEAIAFMEAEDSMYTPRIYFKTLGMYNLPTRQDVVARAYVALGDNASAIGEYERMLTFDPSSADRRLRIPIYRYLVAVLYEAEGQYDLAVQNYERYLHIMKKADDGIEEIEDARQRLEKLRRSSSVIRSSSSPRMTGEK